VRFTDNEIRSSPLFGCLQKIVQEDGLRVVTRSEMIKSIDRLRSEFKVTFKFIEDDINGDVEYIDVEDEYYTLIMLKYYDKS